MPSTLERPPSHRRKGRLGRWLKVIFAFAVSACLLAYVISRVGWNALLSQIETAELAWLLAAIASLFVGYSARILRWSVMLRKWSSSATFSHCAVPFMVSIAMNNLLPLRAGDFFRVFGYRERLGVGVKHLAASVVFERLLDLTTLLAMLSVALMYAEVENLPRWLEDMIGWLSLAAGSALVAIMFLSGVIVRALNAVTLHLERRGHAGAGRVVALAGSFLQAVHEISRGRDVALLLLLSVPVWVFEAGVFLAAAYSLHVGLELSGGMLAASLATLSTLVPSSPGYFGTFHFAAAVSFELLGHSAVLAAAFALLAHAVVWAGTTCTGLVILLVDHLKRGAPAPRKEWSSE